MNIEKFKNYDFVKNTPLEDCIKDFLEKKLALIFNGSCLIRPAMGKANEAEKYFQEKWLNKANAARSFKEFLYMINYKIAEPPRCPICGDYCKFQADGPRYLATCGMKCKTAAQLATSEKKYGAKCWIATKEGRQHTEELCLEKYGVKSYSQAQEIKEKKKQTHINKTGYAYTMQDPDAYQKMKNTTKERYGTEFYSQTQEWRDQYEKTSIKNFGVPHAMQNKEFIEEFFRNSNFNYIYDNFSFDSIAELSYYIYMKDSGYKIIRNPRIINYMSNGKEHAYLVDFEVDGKLVEIKGSLLIDEKTGVWKPHPSHTRNCEDEEEIKILKNKYKDKYKAAVENNVKIIVDPSAETDKCKKYCSSKFGSKDWHKQFQKVN